MKRGGRKAPLLTNGTAYRAMYCFVCGALQIRETLHLIRISSDDRARYKQRETALAQQRLFAGLKEAAAATGAPTREKTLEDVGLAVAQQVRAACATCFG